MSVHKLSLAEEVGSLFSSFSSTVTTDLTKEAVIYLESDDTDRPFRERVVLALNIADYHLKEPHTTSLLVDDGREAARAIWDEAATKLLQTVEHFGLGAKFVKNFRNNYRLVVAQDAVGVVQDYTDDHSVLDVQNDRPDEYFQFNLVYWSAFDLERQRLNYVKRVDSFSEKIIAERRKLASWKCQTVLGRLFFPQRKADLEKLIVRLEQRRDNFLACTPDPRELDSGLILQCDVVTLKEFQLIKQKLCPILKTYLHAMSVELKAA